MAWALVDVEVGLLALAGDVEGRADGDFDGLFGGRVVDGAFADELHLAAGVAAVKADAAGGERHVEVVGSLALELLQQRVLVDDAGVVVLLGDLEDNFAGGVAENDGVRLELAGDVGGGDLVCAGGEVKIDDAAGDGEILIVDGERGGAGAPLAGLAPKS